MNDFDHIQWLVDNYMVPVQKKVEQEWGSVGLEEIMDAFVRADRTPDKVLVDWMVKKYLLGAFRWEDVRGGEESKVSRILESFVRFNRSLQSDKRNLYDYNLLADVFDCIQPFIDNLQKKHETSSTRSLKQAEKDQALKESKVLFRGEDLIVAVPLTQKAAVWWGKGTQWCTAASTSDNYFDYYNEQGPLIVIVLAGKKYQLHITEEEYQWMDETDKRVSLGFVKNNWKQLQPIMNWALKICPSMIYFYPDVYKQNFATDAIAQNGNLLLAIDYHQRTEKMCELALQTQSRFKCIEYVPDEFLTTERLIDNCRMISREFWSRIPSKLKTEKVVEHLLLYNQELFNLIPKSTITDGMVKNALACTGTLLIGMEDRYWNEDNVLEALGSNNPPKLDYSLLEGLGKNNLFTTNIIDKLISIRGENLFSIPSRFWTREVVLKVAASYPSVANRVPDRMWDHGFADELVGVSGICLKYIPEFLVTRNTWLQAVTAIFDSSYKWDEVPENYLDYEFYRSAVEKKGANIFHVPEYFLTSELVQIAIKTSSVAFNKLEQVWNDPELAKKLSSSSVQWDWQKSFETAVRTNPVLYKRVPDQFITPRLVLIAYQTEKYAISFIKPEYIDQNMIFDFVRNNENFQNFLPSQLLTNDVYHLACEVWGKDAIRQSPENVQDVCKGIPYKGYDLDALEKVLEESFGKDCDQNLKGLAL